MRTAVCLQGVDTPEVFEQYVSQIDRLGYDALWLTDSSLHSRNCWAYLTLAARASDRLRIGTAATVAEISGGRVTLGIGAGDRPLLSLAEKPARLADLEKSIEVIRALWAGEHVTAQARGFGLDDAHYRFAPIPDIPIWVSATGPKTLELAGRVADGVILLAGLHPDGIRFALGHIDRGAEQAGRARPAVTGLAYGALADEDAAAAVAAAPPHARQAPSTAASPPPTVTRSSNTKFLPRKKPPAGNASM